MIELSVRTVKALEIIFQNDKLIEQAKEILVAECSENIPFYENSNSEEIERIRFSVLKISQGNLEKLKSAIELAKRDWRDLFVKAGFEKDVTAHKDWFNQLTSN